jgi:Large ribosomal RNA subunit accumulation protein YceD
MSPEFSRLIPVDRIPPEGAREHIVATEQERGALAERFGLLAVRELSARLQLEPWRRGGIKISGRWDARVKQTCVVTLEPFEEILREDITRYFAGQNAPGPAAVTHSVESLEEDEPDLISGGSIDLGELVAESLGLALDPYPRKPGAEFSSSALDEKNPAHSPFAVLKPLKNAPKRKGK